MTPEELFYSWLDTNERRFITSFMRRRIAEPIASELAETAFQELCLHFWPLYALWSANELNAIRRESVRIAQRIWDAFRRSRRFEDDYGNTASRREGDSIVYQELRKAEADCVRALNTTQRMAYFERRVEDPTIQPPSAEEWGVNIKEYNNYIRETKPATRVRYQRRATADVRTCLSNKGFTPDIFA